MAIKNKKAKASLCNVKDPATPCLMTCRVYMEEATGGERGLRGRKKKNVTQSQGQTLLAESEVDKIPSQRL